MTGRIRELDALWGQKLLFCALVALIAALPAPALALIVVFDDGRSLKAESFEIRDERVSISLRGGGFLTVDLDRIERIVEDEIIPELSPREPKPEPLKAPSVRRISSGSLPSRVPYGEQIMAAAVRHQIDPALIAAVIRAESGFSPRAVSRKGARGLMQLMPATARRLGVRQPFDPHENIHGGTAYLSFLAERFGETEAELVLAAYNAGEAAVEEYGGIPPYRETQEYVKKVMRFWSGMLSEETPARRAADVSEKLLGRAAPFPAEPFSSGR